MGQKVWKSGRSMMEKGITQVFAPRWTVPYIIHAGPSFSSFFFSVNRYSRAGSKSMARYADPSTGNKVGYLKNLINGHRLKPYVKAELAS